MNINDFTILRRLHGLFGPTPMPAEDRDAYIDLHKRGLVAWNAHEVSISIDGLEALALADQPDAPAALRYANAVAKIDVAGEAALTATMDLLSECARRHGITRMEFLVRSHFYRGGVEVECVELSQIELRYCDDVHSTGFQGIWTADGGWW